MRFTDPTFLFAFLPAVLALHALAPRAAANAVLLAASLIFYAWGEGAYLGVMVASIAGNFAAAHAIAAAPVERRGRWLGCGVGFNLALLVHYKYSGWFVAEAERLSGLTLTGAAATHLPLGISFFTFQALSYLVDVRRGEVAPTRRPGTFGLYIALFPQLVAGPIVRYRDVATALRSRSRPLSIGEGCNAEGLAEFAMGARRFVIGLAKKVLVADVVAVPADAAFGLGASELTPALAWLGILAYTLQIYFDFSGYSDMAIGMGRMLGFRFPENFEQPYAAHSVTEFWRRWHISLSTWFRDYLYIPLGGNRHGRVRTFINLTAVFLLCGLWHGAAWNFLLWGAFHGVLLGIERQSSIRAKGMLPTWLRRSYTLLAVSLGWVLFRAEDLPHAGRYLAGLFGANPLHPLLRGTFEFVDTTCAVTLVVAILLCVPRRPLWPRLREHASERSQPVLDGVEVVAFGAALMLSLASLATTSHTPFLYFRF